jgi:hypothetical protein
VAAHGSLPLKKRRKTFFRRGCLGRNKAQGKRRNKFETITEVWKIASSTPRIALRTPQQHME